MPDTPVASPARRLAVSMALVLFVLAPSAPAQTLRVTAWNLEVTPSRQTNGTTVVTNTLRIPAAAKALKQLNPDVILLQQIRDWSLCEELAQALKPAKYNVIACSAFADPRTGNVRKQQVAILAKTKAYFSWTESWRNVGGAALPGGYVFAAFHVGKQQVGVFSVQAAPTAGGPKGKQQDPAKVVARMTGAANQVLAQVASVTNWVANRVQVFVIGGTFGAPGQPDGASETMPLRLLENAGFGDAFLELPAEERVTQPGRSGGSGVVADYLFAQPAGCTMSPGILAVPGFKHHPVSCEVGLGPAAAIAAQENVGDAALARAPKAQSTAPKEAAPPPALAKPAPASAPASALERPAQPAVRAEPPPAPASASPSPSPAAAVVAPASSVRNAQLLWVAAGLCGLAAVFGLAARRRRSQEPKPPALLTDGGEVPSSYTVVVGTRSATEGASPHTPAAAAPQPIIHLEAPGATQTQAEALRQRAQAAEERAERSDAILRSGLIPHLGQWLKQKLVRKLISDRAQMLETQQAAARKAIAVEQRLVRIEQQIQRQNNAYQARIEELTCQLLTAKEENRELIRDRIAQVKAEMEAARARLIAQSQRTDIS